jgi:serine/threonine protein kinase
MALVRGPRLGPYEIIAPLEVSGMGEVYRARDTSLARDVAVKVLPDTFAKDPERLARFKREHWRHSVTRTSRSSTASKRATASRHW